MTNLIRCSPIILLLFLVKVVEEKKTKLIHGPRNILG